MVNDYENLTASLTIFAQQQGEPLLEQLDPPRRAMVLMALLALVLLGITLVACIMIGGRWVRRMARGSRGNLEANTNKHATWREALRAHLPNVSTSDTAIADGSSDDTIAD